MLPSTQHPIPGRSRRAGPAVLRSGRAHWLTSAAVAGAVALALGTAGQLTAPAWAAGTSAAGPSWSIQPTPEAIVANGMLAADTCTGPDRCVAVGSSDTSAGTSALAESWNGTTWSIQHVPMPPGGTHSALSAVSCGAANACMAVGYYTNNLGVQVTLAERWDGSAWSVRPTAVPSAATDAIMTGVSCTSATSCVAVGADQAGRNVQDRLAYLWQGTRWTLVEASDPPGDLFGFLSGVSCTAATACIAVGWELNISTDDLVALAQVWDGSTWKVLTVPDPAGAIVTRLYGVSCSAAATCTAVGGSIQGGARSGAPLGPRGLRRLGAAAARAAWGGPSAADGRSTWAGLGAASAASTGGPLEATFAAAWNGTAWSIRPTPNPSGTSAGLDPLLGVSCRSAASCIAVGSASLGGSNTTAVLGESWNGTAWSIVAIPGASRVANSLGGVSCVTTTCIAVGYYLNRADTHLALTVTSAGGGWTVQPAPSPPGAVPSVLVGVSCGAASACAAVGFYDNSPGTTRTLAETWNGAAWRLQPTPDSPALPQNTLASVSCTSASACMAVGQVHGTRSGITLAESWNGTSWTIRPGPAVPGTSGQLSGVSCTSASACMAVGSYDNVVGNGLALAESWNGTAWTLQQVPAPAGGSDLELKSVSCTSPSACTAVGDYSSTGTGNLLAERWNGTAWKIQATPAADGTLYGVSCGSATTCTAVGNSFSLNAGTTTVALQWRGGTWKTQRVPFIPGILPSLYGVSCRSPRDCAAVGGVETGLGVAVTLAEAWNGSTWTVQPTPRPPTGTNSVLAGVAHGPGAGFTAVGSHLSSAQVSTTLAETGPG